MERLGLTERYIENFLFCKEKGFNILTSVVAYPPLLNELEKYKESFENKGIPILFGPYIGEYNGEIYPEAYSEEELELFDFTRLFDFKEDVPQVFHRKGKFCNAGFNVGAVDFAGNIHPCFGVLHEQIGNIYHNINFKKNLMTCPVDFCGCPFTVYSPSLFQKALAEMEEHPLNEPAKASLDGTRPWWMIWK